MVKVHRRNFFLFGNMEKNLTIKKKIHNNLNTFHPTIKFTVEYSKETVNFLDISKWLRILVRGEPMTDLFVKPTDTHQF